jgi:hypothetical protein
VSHVIARSRPANYLPSRNVMEFNVTSASPDPIRLTSNFAPTPFELDIVCLRGSVLAESSFSGR